MYVVTVSGSDGLSTASCSFTIKVNGEPTFNAVTYDTFKKGVDYTFALPPDMFTDANNDKLTLSAKVGGVSFDNTAAAGNWIKFDGVKLYGTPDSKTDIANLEICA